MYRRQLSAALPLSTRAVAASEPDVLVIHLAIPSAGDYESAGPWCMTAWCMSHVLSHEARPERRAVGVTRLGPTGIFMYVDHALSSHCGFFRASVRLARSLLEHPQLTRWSLQREENDQLVDAPARELRMFQK